MVARVCMGLLCKVQTGKTSRPAVFGHDENWWRLVTDICTGLGHGLAGEVWTGITGTVVVWLLGWLNIGCSYALVDLFLGLQPWPGYSQFEKGNKKIN